MNRVERWLVQPDYQVPYHDPVAIGLVEKYMANHIFDGVIYIGDFIDLDFISSFNKGKPGLTAGKTFKKEFALANKILDRQQQIIWENNPYAKFVLIEGNHENRIERYLEEHPENKGTISVEIGLKLKRRGFQWVRHWSKGEIFRLGKANFLHGKFTTPNHPKKMATEYGGSVFYGHTHDMMSHSVSSLLNPGKVHVGQSLGCLCLRDQPYMKGAPSNWEQGFATFFVRPDGNYTYYLTRIVDGEFTGPDGVDYTASK